MEDQIKCPKCGSTQIHADKNGFSAGKTVARVILLFIMLTGSLIAIF